ncbi:hypothetical protein KDL01_34490 [Actinospica durhamensis]|uniref:Uncharacterized protein n=1 Tax=Actinospica durhamensis TaxID=1508375 RepID=A0A941EXW2_9ACTN|nr:hypothetical protein [Actinospica durhamensis]MBR7838428.1 hypothetical protein [Actinospica durhamensis]
MIEEFEQHEGGAADAALISLVGSAFDEGRRGREAPDVLARGRTLRRRKRAVPALGALGVVAVSASLALALIGQNGAGALPQAGSTHSLTSQGTSVNVDNAAFSVHTDAKTGKVMVTFWQLGDQSELEQILAKAGVRTVFHSTTVTLPPGTIDVGPHLPGLCTWLGATELDTSSVLTRPTSASDNSFTIDPSKMPSGSVLAFKFEHLVDRTGKSYGTYIGPELLSNQPTGCASSSK